MIKLKEGQKVLGEDGNIYLIETGDSISKLKEYHFMKDIDKLVYHKFNDLYDLALESFLEYVDESGHGNLINEWYKQNK